MLLVRILSRAEAADKPQIPVAEGAEKVRECGRARYSLGLSQWVKGMLVSHGVSADPISTAAWCGTPGEAAAEHGWLENGCSKFVTARRQLMVLASAFAAPMQLKYLTDNDFALLRSISRRQTFKAREIIIPINSRPNALFILVSGTATVEVIRGQSIARLSSGDICGEMAFLEGDAASASVIAEKQAEVDVLDLPEVQRIFGHYPHLQARFYKSLALMLSQRLRSTSARLAKAASQP